MTEKLIRAIYRNKMIGSMNDDCAAKILAEELERIKILKSKIKAEQLLKEQAKLEYYKIFQKADAEISRLQKNCNHEETQYYGDPAGGNDSYTECTICGATL